MRALRALWYVVFPSGVLTIALIVGVVLIARQWNEHNLWPLAWAWLVFIVGEIGIIYVGTLVERWDRRRDRQKAERRARRSP